MIRIEHLNKEYQDISPLKDVSTEIRDGDVISVIGPSGTGKSTLLRCINQLEKPTSGHIWMDDVEITDPSCDINRVRQKMGMVFQNFNLFGHMTVIENIMAAPVDLLKKSRQEAYDRAVELLRTVGLSDKAFNYPDELSGGQKQRVAIGRAYAHKPALILADEPTGNLDHATSVEIMDLLRTSAEKYGQTLIVVTHDDNIAATADRIIRISDGKIESDTRLRNRDEKENDTAAEDPKSDPVEE